MIVDRLFNSQRGSVILSVLAIGGVFAAFCLLTLGGGSAVSLAAPSAASTTTGTTISTRTTSLGLIVVGASHRTVYMFTKDTKNTSHCGRTCRKTWPRVTTHGTPHAGAGVKQSRLGQTSVHQVTYYGHPLYYFVSDNKKPGNTKGQGDTEFGGRWWVVSPQGAAGTGTTITLHNTPDGKAVAGPTTHQRTLYSLTSDSKSHTTCTGACAASWPPLVTTGKPHAGTGISAGLITTFVRPNGTRQVVYNGHPLYFFSGDDGVGQDNGECFFEGPGTWYFNNAAGHYVKNGSECGTGTTTTPPSTGPPPPTCTHPVSGTVELTTVSATLSHTSGTTADVLAGGDKCTVYMFQTDEPPPATSSHCTTAGCVSEWPPVTSTTANGYTASGNVSAAHIGTIVRGGIFQLTYYGYPLYWYSPDHTPEHDTTAASGSGNGAHAFSEYWYALNASGTKICGTSSFCH